MAKTLLGLDIGTQTIKAVQLSRQVNASTLLSAGFIPTPVNTYAPITPANEKILADTINRLVHDMKVSTTDVAAALPSTKVITRIIEVPQMAEDELTSSIQWEAEQYIPLPLAKVKIDYAIINKNTGSGKMKILLVAAPIEIVEKYMRIISMAGLHPIALETEVLASARCVIVSYPTLVNLMMISFGATTSEIALIHDHTLVYTKSYPMGGLTFTRAIAQELGFEIAQAEEYKKTYGLENDKLEGKIAKTISPFFTTLYGEMEKTVVYFKEQYPSEEIKTVVVCGGGAKLPNLVLSITEHIGLDSQSINPFISLAVDPKILPVLSTDAPMYSVAVGLALKDVG